MKLSFCYLNAVTNGFYWIVRGDPIGTPSNNCNTIEQLRGITLVGFRKPTRVWFFA